MARALRRGDGTSLREQLISLGIIQENKANAMDKPPQGGIVSKPAPASKPTTPNVVKDKNTGLKVNHWFWAAMDDMGSTPAPAQVPSTPAPDSTGGDDTQAAISQLLVDNPGISGPTLYNLLVSKGWTIAPPKIAEADAASSQPAAIFAGTNPLKKKHEESNGGITFRAKFLEATPRSDSNKHGLTFRCVLLKEGMGNFKDQYFYSKEALVSAVPIFEGKKIYADHPTSEEESVRPERSVRDVLGHFENVTVEDKDGQAMLVGDVKVLPDQPFEWARALMRHAVDYATKYPDKDFVGLSINAGGDAEERSIDEAIKSSPEAARLKLEEAKAQGIDRVKWVKLITEAVSCDLVTEAGAGGQITAMLESGKDMEESKMDMKHEAKPAEGEEVKQADAPHSDEQQDIELIKKMLDEYLGKEDHSEETMKAAMEAFKCAEECGDSKEEAYQSAGKMLKMARHMKSKQADAPKDEEKEPKDEEKKEEKPCAEAEEAKPKEAEEKHKESDEAIKLRGENAALKEKLLKIENEQYLEKIMRESHLPMSITKKFREALGAAPKKEEIDSKWKLFREGLQAAGEGDGLHGFVIQPEKTGEVSESVDFTDCMN